MRATELWEVYDYETAIEVAVKTFLNNSGVTAVRQRDVDVNSTAPVTSVKFTAGTMQEQMQDLPTSGEPRPRLMTGNLSIEIRTTRSAMEVAHATIRAKIRNWIYSFGTTLNPLLSFHSILRTPLEQSTDTTIDAEAGMDISMINFMVPFCINKDAWPTTS